MMKKLKCIIIMSNVLAHFITPASCKAYDLSVAYKPEGSSHARLEQRRDWQTTVNIAYGQGSALHAWDGDDQKKNALSLYGSTNVIRLGAGVESISAANTPRAAEFWGPALKGLDYATLPLDQGRIALTGKLKAYEIGLSVTQQLVSGFFIGMFLPIRHVNLYNIRYNVDGDNEIKSASGALITTADSFVENELPFILQEFGYQPLLTPYKKTGYSDLLFMLGWQAYCDRGLTPIKKIAGSMQAGLIAPLGGKKPLDHVVAIPLGYDGCWGSHVRFDGEIGFTNYLGMALHADGTIFLTSTGIKRVTSDYLNGQKGWLLLEKARVKVDPGSLWTIGLYGKMSHVINGLSCLIGYTFSRQEDTHHEIKDEHFLKNFLATQRSLGNHYSADVIATSNDQLKAWQRHSIQVSMEYQGIFGRYNPAFGLTFSLPIAGQRIIKTPLWGGHAAVTCSFAF